MKLTKPKLTLWFLAFLILPIKRAQPAAVPPSPGDNVLVIYANDASVGNGNYDITLMGNIQTALAAMPVGSIPTVTFLPVLTTDSGVWPAMQRHSPAINNFSAYCQVWDVRFYQPPANGGSTTPPNFDTVTLGAGPTTDQSLYTQFLEQGGHLLMLGDNYGYLSRNENLVTFINSVITSGSMGAPWYNFTQNEQFNIIDNTLPDMFETNSANLTANGGYIGTDWPGQIVVAGIANESGGGKVLVSQTGDPDANTYALVLEWFASQIVGGSGKMLAVFDTNTIGENLNNAEGYVQNLYTTLSTCYNIQLTKVASTSTVTTCQQMSYTLCYNNVGSRAVPSAQVWDTIPTCLSIDTAATPAWSSQVGNVYTWNLGTVNAMSDQCLTLVMNVLQVPPCP